MTEFLELRNMSKFYGNIIALQGVTTTVNPGEVTCVLGDNGAGKSTFIKILAGVHQHDEGQFLLEGEEVKFDSPRDALAREANRICLLYTSPSPRDKRQSRMPSSA